MSVAPGLSFVVAVRSGCFSEFSCSRSSTEIPNRFATCLGISAFSSVSVSTSPGSVIKKAVPAWTRELTVMFGKRARFHLTKSADLTSHRCATCITVSPPSDHVSAGSS